MRLMLLCCALFLTAAAGCASLPRTPVTLGERGAAFGYVPVDGLGVVEAYDRVSCHKDQDSSKPRIGQWRPMLDALPDVSVRFAVASDDGKGALTFGPAKMTTAGQTYRAVLDYVNVDVVPVPFYVRKWVKSASTPNPEHRPLLAPMGTGESVVRFEAHVHYNDQGNVTKENYVRQGYDLLTVPVYVGIGMRLTADIRALRSNIALSSLGAIAAEAEANRLTGTFTVQTLGVTGPSVATSLPLPSRLDQTTIENGILALGSSRALIYSREENGVRKTARIVGLYSPVEPDPRLINALYSQLANNLPSWFRPCDAPPQQSGEIG